MPLFGTPSRSAPAVPPRPGFTSDPYVTGDPHDPGRPWYVRHRMRALLATALIPLGVGLIGFVSVWLWVQGGLKEHGIYQQALLAVQQAEEVRAELGDDIEPGFLTTGKVDEEAGTAEIMFSVHGEKGSAGVRVFGRTTGPPDDLGTAVVSDPQWSLTFLDVGVKTNTGREKIITLIQDERPQRFADDAQG